eukprot:gene1703-1956_t
MSQPPKEDPVAAVATHVDPQTPDKTAEKEEKVFETEEKVAEKETVEKEEKVVEKEEKADEKEVKTGEKGEEHENPPILKDAAPAEQEKDVPKKKKKGLEGLRGMFDSKPKKQDPISYSAVSAAPQAADGGNSSDEEDNKPAERPTTGADAEPEVEEIAEILTISGDAEEVDLISLRIFEMSDVELDKLTNCKHLLLRKNIIHRIEPWPKNLATLTDLDLYDNKIRIIECFQDLPNLTRLDLSYNNIKHIQGLDCLKHLTELYLVENKIKDIKGLDNMPQLRLLEL